MTVVTVVNEALSQYVSWYIGSRRKRFYEAPDPVALQAARERRINELKMYDILREIGLYCVYVIVAMLISYDCRSPDAYLVKDNMMSFLDGGRGLGANSNTSISQVIPNMLQLTQTTDVMPKC